VNTGTLDIVFEWTATTSEPASLVKPIERPRETNADLVSMCIKI